MIAKKGILFKPFASMLMCILLSQPMLAEEKADSLNTLAEKYLVSDPQRSFALCKDAVSQARIENDLSELTRAYITLSQLYIGENKYDTALDTLYGALPNINDIKVDVANKLLTQIGRTHYGLRNDSITFSNKLLAINSPEQYKKNCELLLYLIDYYSDHNHLQNAAESIKRAEILAVKAKEETLIHEVLLKRGIVQFKLSYLDRAIISLDSSARYFAQVDSLQKQSVALRYLAEIRYQQGNLAEAHDLFEESLALSDNQEHNAVVLKSLAQIEMTNQEHQKAIDILNEALSLKDNTEDQLRSELYYLLSGSHYLLRNYKLAKNYYDSTITLSKESRNFKLLGQALYGMSKCYEAEGDYKTAIFYLKNAYTASEENFESGINELYAKEDAYYNNIYHTSQINELRKDQYIQELELKNTRTNNKILVFTLIGAFIVVIVLILIYFQNKNFNKKLKEKNITIDNSNKELTEVNKALSHSQINLLKSNKIKDRMFSIITHDIKGALISIRTNMEGMLTDTEEAAKYDSSIESINATINLINQHINWAIAQSSDTLKIDLAILDVDLAIQNSLDLYKGFISAKRIKTDLLGAKDIKFSTDVKMFYLIFRNLLSNALKHSPTDGVITIEKIRYDDSTTVSIRNQGLGIAPEIAEHIFSPPKEAVGNKHQVKHGSGLYLSYRFASTLGGKLWFENHDRDGCTFYVNLPHN